MPAVITGDAHGLIRRPSPSRYRGIGIRIEDDVLVTKGEPEVLTAACPKRVSDIESVLANRRPIRRPESTGSWPTPTATASGGG